MEVKFLTDDVDYPQQTARLLFNEWSSLAAWCDEAAIIGRLERRQATSDHQFTLVATDADNQVVGTCSIITHELDDIAQRVYWLGEVVTDTAWRGKGIASALIRRCISLCAEKNINEIWLYTPDQQAFYRKSGWQEIEQREISAERVSVMVLQLNHGEA